MNSSLVPLTTAQDQVPALIIVRRRARVDALPRILRRRHPQPAHAAGLLPGGEGSSRLVRALLDSIETAKVAGLGIAL